MRVSAHMASTLENPLTAHSAGSLLDMGLERHAMVKARGATAAARAPRRGRRTRSVAPFDASGFVGASTELGGGLQLSELMATVAESQWCRRHSRGVEEGGARSEERNATQPVRLPWPTRTRRRWRAMHSRKGEAAQSCGIPRSRRQPGHSIDGRWPVLR